MAESTIYEPLTEREHEVLALLAEGLSDREIAERLTVAYTTVKWYNRQIFNKLGVDSRSQAIEVANVQGLLDAGSAEITSRHNLPAQTTPFVGREHELADLRRLLRDANVRLITILAPGGMGKTRLALAAGEKVLNQFANGVFFVLLAPLASPEHLVPTIADCTGFQFSPDSRTPKQQLLDYLREKSLLLILDNFEHLLDGAPLISDILHAAPGVKVIVTSRERINLSGETVYTLGGMDYPERDGVENALDYGAVQLFVQCARRARPDFALNGEGGDIVRVCQLAQGMPLAIELAAAWVGALSPGEIVDEVTRSLDFLHTSMRDVPERLRSVRAVFESTWRRLSGEEQTAFMKLSVFRGGCTRKAALAVAGVGLHALTMLADKALITWIPDDERYVVHELLRQYAAEQLEQAGLAEAERDAHSAYYGAAIAERENDLKGGRQPEAINDIAADLENVKAGLQWAIERGQYAVAAQYVNSLGLFYRVQSRFYEGEAFFSAVAGVLANQPGARFIYARALFWHGDNLSLLSHNEIAITVLRQALDIARELDDKLTMALCLQRLGSAAVTSSTHHADAESYCQQALSLSRALGDKFIEAHTLHSLGYIHMMKGELTPFYHFTLQAFMLRREIGEVYGMASSLVNLSDYCLRMGQWEQAEQYIQEGYDLARKFGNLSIQTFHLRNRAAQLFYWGDLQAVENCIREGLAYAREIVEHAHIQALLFQSALLCLLRGQYAEAQQLANDALAEGMQILSGISFQAHYPLVALGCALCGLNEYHADYLQDGLRWAGDAPAANVATLYALTGLACVFAHDRQSERALELLSLAINHPLSPKWWGEREPLTLRLLDELKNALPQDVYAAAWERGKMLDLDAVINELGE